MPWPGSPLRRFVLLLLVLATLGPPGSQAESGVGCLFSEGLCEQDEWCFDDLVFGRCTSSNGGNDPNHLYRYILERESLHELNGELRRLFALGYRWSHMYTQCRLRSMLFTIKNGLSFDPNCCSYLTDSDLEGALKVFEGQVTLDPQEIAIIKYSPSADNPHADYADEIYYPPIDNGPRESIREKILGPNAVDIMDMEDPYADYSIVKRQNWIPQMRRRSVPFFDERYGVPKYRRDNFQPKDALEFLHEYENDFPTKGRMLDEDEPQVFDTDGDLLTQDDVKELYPMIRYLSQMELSPNEIRQILSPDNYDKLVRFLDQTDDTSPTEIQELNSKVNEHGRNGWYDSQYQDDLPEPRIYYDEPEMEGQNEHEAEYGSGNYNGPEEIFRERKIDRIDDNTKHEIFRELKQQQNTQEQNMNGMWGKIQPRPGVYSEGGLVPEETKGLVSEDRLMLRDNLDQLLQKYNLGFKRPERLDVKKPGPNFVTQKTPKMTMQTDDENVLLPTMMKKEPRHPNPIHEVGNGWVDNGGYDYVYVKFKNELKFWKPADSILANISKLLQLEPRVFDDGSVKGNSLKFKVYPNSKGYNVNDVANAIETIKDKLEEETGLEVVSTGIGTNQKMETVVSVPVKNDHQYYIVFFLVCGSLVAMIVAAVILILIRRHIKSKEKLQGLSRPDTEASKDYQDLCRARMATKGQPTGEASHGRVTSLSKESEQSPSSRSSTSSWSEEPALHNMDISTGHMVLSYMEDHLKNKDRLDQEWIALCAYVAEPCETTIALKKENLEKNRYMDVVPYDHARVVLNELSNAEGSNYINASSITDHDPRNPAYIATQGPLPQTAPEFWQLIWEQGAVVIVMLTRLTEGGAAMCHRYWPEEGSELYHIYEVHLVSEHIWCDDYLVRSFYLKNVRTGETRTVTQFHFLSWSESGVPSSTKALLEFRRKVNKSYRGRSCPIVVHCSDGAGRTGTYCLIDMVLSRMAKGAKEIDIAATLEHLRDQRPKMVATKQQFEFVLTAVAEEVHAILKALPPQPPTAQTQEKDKQEK